MDDRTQSFEWCFDEMAAGRMTLDQCLQRYATADPELADALSLADALRRVIPADTRPAQARVRARLLDSIAREREGDKAPILPMPSQRRPALPAPPVGMRRPRSLRIRVAAFAAAVLLACSTAGWAASDAAAAAVPGDPLYGVKRAQETLALATAFSDERRGEVLAVVADHRLAEATTEADRGQERLATDLASEFNGDLQQVIALSATMQAKGEDYRPVVAALAEALARAGQAQQYAAGHGQSDLAQALGADITSAQGTIADKHIKLPDVGPPSGPGTRPDETPGRDQHPTPDHGVKTPTPHGNGQGGGGTPGPGH
jgi:Domain of unknown function (DUF5667)